MHTTTALQIAARIAELTELCTTFQAQFGKQYSLTSDSPAEAHTLHREICDKQEAIAALLDPQALRSPASKTSEWWRWQQTMDIATASALAQAANQLIASCAYAQASPNEAGASPNMMASQAAIAAMLHPDARGERIHQPDLLTAR